MALEIIPKETANAAGLKHYFTGHRCENGHVARRYLATDRCVVCELERNQEPHRRAYFAERYRKLSPELKAKYKAAGANRARAGRAKLGSTEWRNHLLAHARNRAKKNELPFDKAAVLDLLKNPPTHCPVLRIEFTPGGGKGRRNSTPSIDRIRPELGYVRGNIALISLHANRIKNSATVAEIRAVADWLESQVGVTHACEST